MRTNSIKAVIIYSQVLYVCNKNTILQCTSTVCVCVCFSVVFMETASFENPCEAPLIIVCYIDKVVT